MKKETMSEQELIAGCISNHPESQKALFNLFSNKMLAICLRYTSNRAEAEDILQDGFIKVFGKIESFKNEGSLEGWIKRIMVNTALDQLRKNKKLLTSELDENWDTIDQQKATDNLDAKDLMRMVQSLPNGFRTVFNLYAIEGYSHKEIGDMLGINESTSKSQYSRARTHLMRMLSRIEQNEF